MATVTIDEQSDDVRDIEAMIARQLPSISWTPDKESDWDVFAQDFLPGASLYAAARPAQSQSVAALPSV